jgi:hypothetical protein
VRDRCDWSSDVCSSDLTNSRRNGNHRRILDNEAHDEPRVSSNL